MTKHLHLLGGTGRIGNQLIQSLSNQPIDNLLNIWTYCDGNKAYKYSLKENQKESDIILKFRNYSAFHIGNLISNGDRKE